MAPAKKKQRLSLDVTQEPVVEEIAITADPPSSKAPEENPVPAATASAEQQGKSIFVRALPASTTNESLTALFSDSFPVRHATAVIDPATNECRGYGFVTFADVEDAKRAREEFHNRVVDGRKLRVEVAERRTRDESKKEPGEAKKTPRERERQQEQPPKLIVRNLPWSIKGSEQLTKLFQSYGKVKKAYVPKKAPGLLSGFGFVIMRGKQNAEKAIEGVNGKEVDGRTLAVDWAVERDVFKGATKEVDEDEEEPKEDAGEEEGDYLGMHRDEEEEKDEISDDEEEDGDGDDDDEINDDEDDDDEINDDEDDDEGGINLGTDEDAPTKDYAEDRSNTLFVRNLPFTCTDEDLEDHFAQFGSTRYARVVMDQATERSKGTGFVCFYNIEDADACIREAPRRAVGAGLGPSKDNTPVQPTHSILQNEFADPAGKYTLDGRVLQVSRAVNKTEASRLTQEGVAHRFRRDTDKRRLFLLSEGSISARSALWQTLAPSERAMRDASAKQRKTLIESNPSLHLSLTRLSIRNIPRSVTSKELKNLAREAVVGFATDVKAGHRQRLSKEELSRGGEGMIEAEKDRKRAGKGIVKQAKVVFEGSSGSKVREDSGAGRSRGYGFIEYYTHRSALMGLRWLNGHALNATSSATNPPTPNGNSKSDKKSATPQFSRADLQDRKKRLIVEFAIENAQVVLRRSEREVKARERGSNLRSADPAPAGKKLDGKKFDGSRKRKRPSNAADVAAEGESGAPNSKKKAIDEKIAKRNFIIGKKRAMRKANKAGRG